MHKFSGANDPMVLAKREVGKASIVELGFFLKRLGSLGQHGGPKGSFKNRPFGARCDQLKVKPLTGKSIHLKVKPSMGKSARLKVKPLTGKSAQLRSNS